MGVLKTPGLRLENHVPRGAPRWAPRWARAKLFFIRHFFEPEQPAIYVSYPYLYLVKSVRGPE